MTTSWVSRDFSLAPCPQLSSRLSARAATGWHFDNSEFSVSLIVQPAEEGGAFEYAPRSRQSVEALPFFPHDRVSEHLEVLTPPLLASSLYLFLGRESLHRVSPVRKGERVNAILAYNSTPGERLNDYTLRKFFGRTRSNAQHHSMT